jgi:hypothetical protein
VWQSADPILGRYLPTGNKDHDAKLSGMGGVFNSFNLAVYTYAHQNPLKLVDPDGNMPFHAQEMRDSCVPASARNMILITTGKDIPESTLRQEFRHMEHDPNHDFTNEGSDFKTATLVMNEHGAGVRMHFGVSLNALKQLVADRPAMVGFSHPEHAVVLLSVTNGLFNVMDPVSDKVTAMTEASFASRYESGPDDAVLVPTSPVSPDVRSQYNSDIRHAQGAFRAAQARQAPPQAPPQDNTPSPDDAARVLEEDGR